MASEPDTTALDIFLGLVERSPDARMHASVWISQLGAELVSLLRRTAILEESGLADWFPCEIDCDAGCPQRVERTWLDGREGFVSRCCGGHPEWGPTHLNEPDLLLLAVSRDGFIHRLREAMKLSGLVETTDAGFSETICIGWLRGRPVYLALLPGIPGFEGWLASRRHAYVIVPVGRWLSASAYENFGPGSSTELIVLRNVLKVNAEGFVVQWAPRDRPDPESAILNRLTNALITCVVQDGTGRRGLTFAEYEHVLKQARAYDLFVDMTEAGASGGYRAGRRHLDGRHEEVTLTPSEAAVLVELILAGRAMRVGEIRSVLSNDVSKIIERGRRKLDIPLGRFEWRMIHTLKASNREAKAYQFRPPEGTRWAIVLPNSDVDDR